MKILSATTHKNLIGHLESTDVTVSMNLIEFLTLVANYGCSSTLESYEAIRDILLAIDNTADIRRELSAVHPDDLERKVDYQEIRDLLVEQLREAGVS